MAGLAAAAAVAVAASQVRLLAGNWFFEHLGRDGAYEWGRVMAAALIVLLGTGVAVAVYVLIALTPGSARRS